MIISAMNEHGKGMCTLMKMIE